MSVGYSITLVAFYLGIILVLAEAVNRLSNTNGELTRKIVHIGTGNVILLAWWLKIPASIGIGAACVACAIALTSYFVPILPSINSVGRQSLGTFFYAVSMGVLVGCFWYLDRPQYAAIGILVMAWGDGMAAIIGQNYGKHLYQIGEISKSWEGSLTMAIVSFLVISCILWFVQGNSWQTWLISAIVAVVATGLEAFSKLGIDNLTVPLGSAALAFALSQVF